MNIEDLQNYCKSLPETTESVKWEDHLCFCIGEKMYAVTSLAGRNTLSFKVPDEEFARLIESQNFISAPYLGRYKWVFTEDFTVVSESELKGHIDKSYELIKSKLPKALQKKISTEQ